MSRVRVKIVGYIELDPVKVEQVGLNRPEILGRVNMSLEAAFDESLGHLSTEHAFNTEFEYATH